MYERSDNWIMKKNEQQPLYRAVFAEALICAVFIIPFIVRLKIMHFSGRTADLFNNTDGASADWFLYWKERAVVWIAALCIAAFIGGRIFPDNPYRKSPLLEKGARLPMICLGAYALFGIISSLLSQERDAALWGGPTECEGILAVCGYGLLFAAGCNYINEPEQEKFYKKAMFVLIAAASLLAVLEYFWKPLLTLPFVKYIIAPSEYRDLAADLHMRNTFREAVLGFYNSNYLGGFCTIIFPVSVYYVTASKGWRTFAASAVSVLSLAAVITSNSTAAFYTVIAETVFLTVLLAVKKKIALRGAAAYASVLAAGVIAGALISGEFLSGIRKSAENTGAFTSKESAFLPDDITIEDYSVRLTGEGAEYLIKLPSKEGEVLAIENAGDTDAEVIRNDFNSITVIDRTNNKQLELFIFEGILHLNLGFKENLDFAVTTKGVRLIVQNKVLLSEIPSAHFNGTSYEKYYNSLTGRGYIWLNSLPLLKKSLIVGRGPGSFPYEFVQNDVSGLYRTHGTAQVITDKPHNWYLQIALTCGIPALIAVLTLFGAFVFAGGKRLITAKDTDVFGICLYTGLCGFMLTGMVNDSIITVNPFFWFNFGAAYYRVFFKCRETA